MQFCGGYYSLLYDAISMAWVNSADIGTMAKDV
jgi:hypothetical protein